MIVLAVDPGGTTGLATYDVANDCVRSWQLEGVHHLRLWKVLDDLKPNRIVYEVFDNRGNHAAQLDAVEYIGVLRLWAITHDRPIIGQHPGDVKQQWTDQKLRTIQYYSAGRPHANDAMRHLLYFYTVGLKDYLFARRYKEMSNG
jgi:hypothetical protein